MRFPSIDAIIVAGGAGTRLGTSAPKAFIPLGGMPMFIHSLVRFDAHEAINTIILVVPPDMIPEAQTIVSNHHHKKALLIVPGGAHRWQSVNSGVQASQAEWVLIHDAARPFVTDAVIDAVLEKISAYDCVITATPEVDTIRRFSKDRALETIDRSQLVRVGTPQLFRAVPLKESFLLAGNMQSAPTDEAMLMEALGVPVGIAWGDPLNFKITTPSDLALAEALCAARQ